VATFDLRRTARTISTVENGAEDAKEIVRNAYRAARYPSVVGVTGPPGAGKSTLIDRLALHWAERGEHVAVLAVDPTSPFTGGALLGDRVRMDRAASHPNVFVRSLASRGALGGLSSATTDLAAVLGALGFGRVVLESVGAGQSDLAIGMVADVVLVLAVPGLGDHIQAAKAGILEIGDVYVANKCDLPGADLVTAQLNANLDLLYPGSAGRNAARAEDGPLPGNAGQQCRHGKLTDAGGYWRPPVLAISASDGTGISGLAASADDFLDWSRTTGRYHARLNDRLRSRILDAVNERLRQLCVEAALKHRIDIGELAMGIALGTASPDDAAQRLIAALLAAPDVTPTPESTERATAPLPADRTRNSG